MLLAFCVRAAACYRPYFSRVLGAQGNHNYLFSTLDEGEAELKRHSGQQQEPQDDMEGTEYSNWILARSAKFNHEVSYLKRRFGRDRYNIHKLTNMEFMCNMVNREDKYSLNLNECIVLLAQMNHVCNVLKKDKGVYGQFTSLTTRISKGIKNPDDYICIGTFLNVLVDLGNYHEKLWVLIMDSLFVKKYDQEYDELFGLYCGLSKYKQNVEQFSDYFELHKNKIIYNIPIIYRNSLEVIRQYIKFNVYNLKECRILFKSLHENKINEKYFWKSVNNWFNIYIKEQLQRKEFEEFFIVSESAIEKVLFDDGMIRPRSVLEELSEIAFILSEHGFISDRFLTFVENLINFSIERGSELFIKYLEIEKSQSQRQKKKESISINQHIKTIRETEDEALKKMEQKYKTIFVNPTDLSSESIVHILIVIKRTIQHHQKEKGSESHASTRVRSSGIDQRVLNWLIVRLCQPKMRYTVNQLLKIIYCQGFLQSMKINLNSLILQKVKDVRSTICSLDDLANILHFLSELEFERVSYIMEDFLLRAHPKDILELTRLIQRESMSEEDCQLLNEEVKQIRKDERNQEQLEHILAKQKSKRWMPYLTKYFLKLPSAVNCHQKYYSFQENCYFLYLLLKNQQYWQNHINYEYQGQMQKLKHSIKIASYSRGFKLQMGTYFYKLMNYIDLVAFFDGG